MKSKAKITGIKGEKLAANYLADKGYIIRERNYHGTHGEIDIICQDDRVLVFIEVKSFRSSKFGHPVEWVDRRKQERIGNTANEYLSNYCHDEVDCRFDIITVDLNTLNIEHFENAFWLE